MGLGLCLLATAPELRKKAPSAEVNGAFLTQLAGIIPECIESLHFKEFTHANFLDNTLLQVKLHPAAESVEFRITDEGKLMVSANTGTAGPGYHAFLVNLLDALTTRLKLSWLDEDEVDEDYGDETGYWMHRDFFTLQEEMLNWLRAVGNNVLQLADMRSIRIALPMDVPTQVEPRDGVFTSLGWRSKQWAVKVTNPNSSDDEIGADFFPWWQEGENALFWKNVALVLMWCDVRWSVPVTEAEREVSEKALRALYCARDADQDISLPEIEWDELRQLVFDQKDLSSEALADPQRIGYRRRLVKAPLFGGWTIELPGYFHDGVNEEGTTQYYEFTDKTLQCSAFSFSESDDGAPKSAAERLSDFALKSTSDAKPISYRHEQAFGEANVSCQENDEGTFWILQGVTVCESKVCYITITFSDKADQAWAVKTWQSLEPPHNGQEEE